MANVAVSWTDSAPAKRISLAANCQIKVKGSGLKTFNASVGPRPNGIPDEECLCTPSHLSVFASIVLLTVGKGKLFLRSIGTFQLGGKWKTLPLPVPTPLS